MPAMTQEERVQKLETKVQQVQEQLAQQPSANKRGWRWFVGIDANNPHFEDAVRLGQEWRNADTKVPEFGPSGHDDTSR